MEEAMAPHAFDLRVEGSRGDGTAIRMHVPLAEGDAASLHAALAGLDLDPPRGHAMLRLSRRASDPRWPLREKDVDMLATESLNVHTVSDLGRGDLAEAYAKMGPRAQVYALPADGATGFPGWMAVDADWSAGADGADPRIFVYTGQGTEAPRSQCLPLADAFRALEHFLCTDELRTQGLRWTDAC